MPARNHFAALDGLRGLAAMSVVLFHPGHWLVIASALIALRLFDEPVRAARTRALSRASDEKHGTLQSICSA